MDDKVIPHLVARFLSWKLPHDFRPDAGISFVPEYNNGTPEGGRHEPSGTNLLNAEQAFAMFRHVLEHPAVSAMPERDAGLQSTLFTTQRDLEACLEASKSLQARAWTLQARITELEAAMPQRELLREALSALSAMTRGLKEADYYCPDDVAEDHTVLISASIAELREARAAADKIRAALERQQKGETP